MNQNIQPGGVGASLGGEKIGLALSGGGFRASLFHIGVLARLAELDLLHRVECLSCVSGGSIVGAQYYLELRKLLSEKADGEIVGDDYRALVQRLAERFLAGVQRNVRVSLAADWTTNLKLAFAGFSRTARLAELYEELFYAPVTGKSSNLLKDLRIFPKGEAADFHPRTGNAGRHNKVPMLVLNATTLNTGHNWQFTASWMGEPPAGVDDEIDAGYRLRRLYHEEAPRGFAPVTLGQAVAASSCVPGLFEPLALEGLYQGRTVRLVDGGVQDNQGAAALVEQGCTVLIVSDASGQMECEDDPPPGAIGVLLRVENILQARVRTALYGEQQGRRLGGMLHGLAFLHLKKDLEVRPLDWIGCATPSIQPERQPLTSYGVLKTVQQRLATMRTDLDSFSDMEAYALMLSGYRMSERFITADTLGFAPPAPHPHAWRFLDINRQASDEEQAKPLLHQLSASDQQFFRVWRLVKPLQVLAWVLAALAAAGLALAAATWWKTELVKATLGQLIVAILLLALGILGGKFIGWVRDVLLGHAVRRVAYGLAMALGGFLLARLHLAVFDRLFLRQGRVGR